VRRDYADALIRLHRYGEAREQVRWLLDSDPREADFVSLAAMAAMGMGDQETALALYRALLADRPDSADVYLWSGHALMMVSKALDAVAFYRRAAILRPDFGDAYWSLANLKRYRFSEDQIAVMRAAEAASRTAPADRYHLCFALGKALEDRNEIAESWRYYERGNALKREVIHYRPEIIETNTQAQIETCTPSFFASRSWPLIPRSKARRNCPISRLSSSIFSGGSRTSTLRAIPACWRT
jgi:tetratricopeptide (TPR) repeat protein